MKNILFYSLDLEMEQPSNEIISIGVAYQTLDGVDRENYLITPSEPISEFIQGLTGLTDDMFDASLSREQCFKIFSDAHNTRLRAASEGDDKMHTEAVVWGVGDIPLLKKQMREVDVGVLISNRFIDVKTLMLMYRLVNGKSISQRMSLKSGLAEHKMKFEGSAHDSSWDAYNTLALFERHVAGQRRLVSAVNEIKDLQV